MPTATRTEHVKLTAQLTGQSVSRLRPHVDTILRANGQDWFPTDGTDEITLTYNFFIKYFGNVEATFRAYLALFADPDVVVKTELAELTDGEVLIQRLLDRLREVRQVATARQTP
jgi:hypothetical protein